MNSVKTIHVVIVMVALMGCIVLFGSQDIDERLQPVEGVWKHKADNGQVWTYKFKSSSKVKFSLDYQSRRWDITNIEVSGNTTRIWVDDLGVQKISILKLNDKDLLISSGLHPPMVFTK